MKFPSANMQPLIDLCEPASFGRDKQNVLDPSYRSALALSTDKFYTSFDLAAYDILHTIETAIMPDASAIRAELYKLNIYRPGDFFKPHVDTPRGDGMFGSLVVCLPQSHTGGDLVIRHDGAEQAFEFGFESGEKLQWAAFYSDCEHEIKPVTSGHRVTMTYNLYVSSDDHASASHCPSKKPKLYLPGLAVEGLELYRVLGKALACEDFLPRGGRLVWRTQHYYPHTTTVFLDKIESMLKGTDALTFKALQRLGLGVRVAAVNHCEGHSEDDEDEKDEQDEDEDEGAYSRQGGEMACLASLKGFQEFWFGEGEGGPCHRRHKSLYWVTEFDEKKGLEQSAIMKYGNNWTSDREYSSAVIVAKVPAWKDRSEVAAPQA